MFDAEALTKQLNDAVRSAVKAEAHRLQGTIAMNDAIISTLKKPMLIYPGDVTLVLGIGRTTLHTLVSEDPTFPPVSAIGRRQFVNRDKFMTWLESKEATAA